MRVIILAAGQGVLLDGMVKCLIRAPHDRRPLLERMIESFGHHQITVVVGFRAVSVMEQYPDLHYVYNPDWATSNNSYSLGLALTEDPCYVVSSDLVFENDLVQELDEAAPNLALTERRENRILSSLNCARGEQERIREFYVGPIRSPDDPEAIGLFKVTQPALLRQWKRNCLRHGNLFVGQNLPLAEEGASVQTHDIGSHLMYEINNPSDYLRALRVHRPVALA